MIHITSSYGRHVGTVDTSLHYLYQPENTHANRESSGSHGAKYEHNLYSCMLRRVVSQKLTDVSKVFTFFNHQGDVRAQTAIIQTEQMKKHSF